MMFFALNIQQPVEGRVEAYRNRGRWCFRITLPAWVTADILHDMFDIEGRFTVESTNINTGEIELTAVARKPEQT